MTRISTWTFSMLLYCCYWSICIASPLADDKGQVKPDTQLITYVDRPSQQISLITEQSPPGGYLGKKGNVEGVTVELLRIISQRLNENTKFYLFPWARAFEMAKSEPNIGLFETIRSAEREPLFQWVGPLKIYHISLYARSSKLTQSFDPSQLPGRWIACANRGSEYVSKIESLGFQQGKNLVLTVNEDNCAKLMLQGRVDLAPYNENSIEAFSKALDMDTSVIPVLPLGEVKLYLAFSKDVEPNRVSRWQTALEKSYSDGTMRTLYQGVYSELQIKRLENSIINSVSTMVLEPTK
jgi:polar amino acid transport system substrate-binding protein